MFKKYWLDILCMKCQLVAYDPTTNTEVPQKWLSEVDLTKMFFQYHHKVGKAKYSAKTLLKFWTLLQTKVPSSTLCPRSTDHPNFSIVQVTACQILEWLYM